MNKMTLKKLLLPLCLSLTGCPYSYQPAPLILPQHIKTPEQAVAIVLTGRDTEPQ